MGAAGSRENRRWMMMMTLLHLYPTHSAFVPDAQLLQVRPSTLELRLRAASVVPPAQTGGPKARCRGP